MMLKLFRKVGEPPHQTAMAMIGARPGDNVLFCGASRPDLAGAVGAITGLNGQTTVVDRRDDGAARVEAGAAEAGALVDFEDAPLTLLPFDAGRFDAAVIPDGLSALGDNAGPALAEAVRVIRPGGRLVIVDPVGRPGVFGLLRKPATPPPPADSITTTLTGAGLRGVRLLADVEGVRYFEGTKPYPG